MAGIIGCWIMLRAAMLSVGPVPAVPVAGKPAPATPAAPDAGTLALPAMSQSLAFNGMSATHPDKVYQRPSRRLAPMAAYGGKLGPAQKPAAYTSSDLAVSNGQGLGATVPTSNSAKDAKRWSGSAWLFVRGSGEAPAFATGGQLGGSQLGVRVARRLGDTGLALAGRLSSPLHDTRGAEGVVGAVWTPLKAVPVHLAVERRIAIGPDGRDAFAAYASGGFWKSGLPHGLVSDGYGQAGIVGVARRDLFADGAVRVMRPMPIAKDVTLDVGGGVWGAVQPGVSRVDVGPHIGVRMPLGKTFVSGSLDARIRVAGDARPGSGVALTLATDF